MLKRLLFVVLLALASVAQGAVYSLPWGPKPQFVDANGAPMSGGSLLTFLATSTTPQVTYTDSTGGVANPTTITLNTRGETPNEVWLTGGVSYKFVLKDSSGSTVWTVDTVSGVNDVTSALSEWVSGPTPTFVSATSFTLAGDQTLIFTVGRRIKTTNSGGTVYSTITASSFGASTTVTVVNDASVLDSGLSAVSYGLLQASNPSIPSTRFDQPTVTVASATTTNLSTAGARSVTISGTTTITAITLSNGQEVFGQFSGALTLTNGASLILPGGANIATAAGDTFHARGESGSVTRFISYTPATGKAVAPSNPPTSFATTGTFTITLTGFTSNPTGTAVYSITNNVVTLFIPVLTATSNSTAMTATGLPAAIQPVTSHGGLNVNGVQDNGGTLVNAQRADIGISGAITFYSSNSATGFTAANTKGLGAGATLVYNLN